MAGTALELVPYLHFQGDCEEALEHYARCLGGRLDGVQRYGDADMGMEIPEAYRTKALHARLAFGDNVLMASDDFPGQQLEPGSRV
jgi:PhnB protein